MRRHAGRGAGGNRLLVLGGSGGVGLFLLQLAAAALPALRDGGQLADRHAGGKIVLGVTGG
jgi:UDP-N-acetylglucosamine:LPS N-acetylglucosamine transferase